MARSILAVLIGYLTIGVSAGLLFGLTGHDPEALPGTGFLVFSIAYGIAFSLLGGYLAAVIAGRAQLAHASAVATVLAVIAVVSLVVQKGSGAMWSQLATLFLMAPAAAAGGYLRKRSVESQ